MYGPYIYLHLPLKYTPSMDVGKYTSPMDGGWYGFGVPIFPCSPAIRRTTGDHLLSQAVPVEKRLRLLPEEAVREPRRVFSFNPVFTWWFILEVTAESFKIDGFEGLPFHETTSMYILYIYM